MLFLILPSDENLPPTTTITALGGDHTWTIPPAEDDGNSEHHQKVHTRRKKSALKKNEVNHMEL